MDILTLKGLQYHALHGYYEKEQIEGNDFEVDLIFYAVLNEAGRMDDLTETIDYEKAEQIVSRVMKGPSIKLIETLVLKIGDQLFDTFGNTRKLEVRVRKLHPPLAVPAKYSQIERIWTR